MFTIIKNHTRSSLEVKDVLIYLIEILYCKIMTYIDNQQFWAILVKNNL